MPKSVTKKKRSELVRANQSILSFFPRLKAVPKAGEVEEPESALSSRVSQSLTHLWTPETQNGKLSKKPASNHRKCPKYKWLKGTPFTVDAFKYGVIGGCAGYFLTHFHYDHYGGLSSKFEGTVYCSEVTARLVRVKFGQSVSLVPLCTNVFVKIDGYDIFLMDANHCPGSVMILFRLPNGDINLHTGDFRAHKRMLLESSALVDFVQSTLTSQRIDTIFLDTTFCSPQYLFPEQKVVIAAAVEISREALVSYPDALILCGMYTIGKERFVVGLAEQLDVRVWLPAKQRELVAAAAEGGCEVCCRLLTLTTAASSDARLRVIDMGKLSPRAVITNLLPADKPIIAWKPSGWMYSPLKKVTETTLQRLPCSRQTFFRLRNSISIEMISKNVFVFGAAYSEHSSFSELKDFITELRPVNVLPTVFGGAARNAHKHIEDWLRSNGASGARSNRF